MGHLSRHLQKQAGFREWLGLGPSYTEQQEGESLAEYQERVRKGGYMLQANKSGGIDLYSAPGDGVYGIYVGPVTLQPRSGVKKQASVLSIAVAAAVGAGAVAGGKYLLGKMRKPKKSKRFK